MSDELDKVADVEVGDVGYYKADILLIERIAILVEKEAVSWAEGFAVPRDGKLVWAKSEEWAHVRHHKLTLAVENLRKLASRLKAKRAEKGAGA